MENSGRMNNLPLRILEYAEAKPEATPIQAKNLLHLGDRAVVAWALPRLVRWDRFLRICRGIHIRPIQIPFGLRMPSLAPTITALRGLGGEIVVTVNRAISWLGPGKGEMIPDAVLPNVALRSRSLSTPDCRTLSAAPPKSEFRRWR